MASSTVVLHYRRSARYGLNVLLGAAEQELRPGAAVRVGAAEQELRPGAAVRIVAAEGLAAAMAAAAGAVARGDRVLVAWSFYSPEAAAVAGELARFRHEVSGPVRHVAGGVHATAEPLATLEAGFDLVVVGEGEAPFVGLLGALAGARTDEDSDGALREVAGVVSRDAGGEVRRNPVAPRQPLGRYPAFALRHRRFNPIEITRGCVYGCTFCQTPFMFKARFRHRPVDDVARHAAAMVAAGRRDVRFITPTALSYGAEGATPDLVAVEELLSQVRRASGPQARIFFGTFPSEVRPEHVSAEALALIGRYCDNDNLVIGGQSGSDAVLERTNRGHGAEVIVEAARLTVAAGLRPNVDLLFGLPGEAAADIEASLELADRLAALGARVHGHSFMPLPGTPLRDAAVEGLSVRVRARLDRLASDGALYGSWRRQEQVAATLVQLRPTRRSGRS